MQLFRNKIEHFLSKNSEGKLKYFHNTSRGTNFNNWHKQSINKKNNMKIFLLFVFTIFLWVFCAKAQEAGELVVGGNMEDENAWTVIQLDKPDFTDFGFNYNASTPSAGQGGCFRAVATVNQEADLFCFQPINVIAGEEYTVSGAFRDVGANVFQFWASLCYVTEEPQEGQGLSENVIVGFNTWTASAAGMNATFQDSGSVGSPVFTAPGDSGEIDTIYFGINIGSYTGGANIYEFDVLVDEISLIGPIPSEVGIKERIKIRPINYSLYQNYPNPFNPATNIRFDIIEAGLVTLKVYNFMGEEIITLLNEYKNVGTYDVDFNAKNFTSGVYFYKISSGNFSETKKMLLIK